MTVDLLAGPVTRRAFLRGAAATLGAVAVGACTGGREGGEGGRPTIRIQGGQFGFPSPFAYIAAPGYWRMSYVFDTLLWADSTGRELPWLASAHHPSEDGLLHRLELRQARWHDGRPLTAEDVAFTFEYFGSKPTSPLVIATPRGVTDVRATGERTVEIRLEEPDVTFTKSVLASVPIVPRHVWSSVADPQAAQDEEVLVGSGPYRVRVRSEAEGRMLYEANDAFFLGSPYVRRIEEVQVDDELAAVRAGQLDGATAPVEGVRNDVLEPFRRDPAFGIISQPTGFAFPLYFNLRRGGALADVRFRRACLMSIDRQGLVTRLLTGNGTVGSAGFLPPGHPHHVEVDGYPYDLEAANRLLDEAGYRRTAPGAARRGADGRPLRFTLYVSNTVPQALPELLSANLRDAGIEVERQVVDLVRLLGIKTGGNYDLLVTLYPGPVGTSPNGDPDLLRPIFHSNPPNQLYAATGYASPKVDSLLERQRVTPDENERRALVAEVQRAVARDLPVAVLYYTTLFFVFRRQVFDQWYYTPGGFGPGVPDVYNKHVFVTGRKTGLTPRSPSRR